LPFRLREAECLRHDLYGWDGSRYRAGPAFSPDLPRWDKVRLILGRGPAGSLTEYNLALTASLRGHELFTPADLREAHGLYTGSWHVYPNAG